MTGRQGEITVGSALVSRKPCFGLRFNVEGLRQETEDVRKFGAEKEKGRWMKHPSPFFVF